MQGKKGANIKLLVSTVERRCYLPVRPNKCRSFRGGKDKGKDNISYFLPDPKGHKNASLSPWRENTEFFGCHQPPPFLLHRAGREQNPAGQRKRGHRRKQREKEKRCLHRIPPGVVGRNQLFSPIRKIDWKRQAEEKGFLLAREAV